MNVIRAIFIVAVILAVLVIVGLRWLRSGTPKARKIDPEKALK